VVLQPAGFCLLVRGVLQSYGRGWQTKIALPLCFPSETETTLPVFGKVFPLHSCCLEGEDWPSKVPREQKKIGRCDGRGRNSAPDACLTSFSDVALQTDK